MQLAQIVLVYEGGVEVQNTNITFPLLLCHNVALR